MELGVITPQKSYVYDPNNSLYTVFTEKGNFQFESNCTELNLSNKQLSDKDIQSLFDVFENGSMRDNLKKLNLSHNCITSEGCVIIANALKFVFPVLESFDISYNAIGDKGLEHILTVMRKHNPFPCPYIRFIDVSSNSITVTGSISIHKMIRRTDGILNVAFDNNPINGEGIGFIFSAKFWESFQIIRDVHIFHIISLDTHLDNCFSLFAKAYSSKAFNIKHLTIKNNNLSLSSVQLLSSLFSSLPIPTLQTLVIEEPLRETGMNSIIQIGLCRSLVSLKKLVLDNCYIPLTNVFSLVRAIDQGAFPMLREVEINQKQSYSFISQYIVKVNSHSCVKCYLNLEDSTNVPLTDFYISCETQAFSFINHSHISITDLLNSNFTALSLHSLTEVSLDFVEESLSVLSNILYLLPPSVQSLSLHHLSFVETSEENVPTEEQPGKIPRKITHLTLSNVNNTKLLLQFLYPLLPYLSVLDIKDTSFTDEDITNLYDYTKECNIQLNSLQIDDQSLSSDSVHLMSLIAPSPEEEEVEVIDEKKDRCRCIII